MDATRRREISILDLQDAFEAYYNVAITHWLSATADLQVIDRALKKSLNSSGTALNEC
jgi:porin